MDEERQALAARLGTVIIFGKWSLWIVIGVFAFSIAAGMAAAGQIVLAVVLVIAVVIGGYYSLRGDTNYW